MGAVVRAVMHQAPNGVQLTVPTYIEGNDEVVHPSVVDAGSGGWNGHRWWMAATPYPASDNTKENPSIWVSDDRVTWTVPAGGTNPVAPFPGSGYNSDPHLVLHAGTLHLFWRYFGADEYIKHRSSTDGVTWSSETTVLTSDFTISRPISPAVVRGSDGTWRMWAIDIIKIGDGLGGMGLWTASAPTGPWTFVGDTTLTAPSGKELWHVDVVEHGGLYQALVMVTNPGSAGGGGQLYIATSPNGTTFTRYDQPTMWGRSDQWDGSIYRASWLARDDDEDTWDIWYSGLGGGVGWGIGHTTIDR